MLCPLDNTTPCLGPEPDSRWWTCPVHAARLTASWTKLCRTRESYRRAWQEGRGPGQVYPPRRVMVGFFAETPWRKRDGLRGFFRAFCRAAARGRDVPGLDVPLDGREAILTEVSHDGPGRVWRGPVEDVMFATGEPVELQLTLDGGRYTLEPVSENTWPFEGVGLAEGPHDPAYEWLQWRHPLCRTFGLFRLRDRPDALPIVAVLTESPSA